MCPLAHAVLCVLQMLYAPHHSHPIDCVWLCPAQLPPPHRDPSTLHFNVRCVYLQSSCFSTDKRTQRALERREPAGAVRLSYTILSLLRYRIARSQGSLFASARTHSGAWRLMTNDSDLSACFGAPVVNLYCILTVVISASALRLRVREMVSPRLWKSVLRDCTCASVVHGAMLGWRRWERLCRASICQREFAKGRSRLSS